MFRLHALRPKTLPIVGMRSWQEQNVESECDHGTCAARPSTRMEPSSRHVFWILLAAIIAMLAKVYCAVTTLGTEDVALYFRFGEVTDARGLAFAMTNPVFNHTPLVAEYVAFLFSTLEGKAKWFPLLIKLPGIVASFGSVFALIWLQRRIPKIPNYAVIVFALSPAAFMIDGFHGNLDSVMIFLLLLAGCACAAKHPSWIVCAVCLGMAAQIKVIALLIAPVFAFFWLHRGRGFHFSATAGAAIVLGWLPGIMADPFAFAKNVVGYGSVWGMWGITYLLRATGYSEFGTVHWLQLTNLQLLVSQILKLSIIACVMVAAWRNRQGNAATLFGTVAFCWMAFFTFAPGMAPQYMVWFAPFVLVWNARWYTALIAVVSATLFAYYQVTVGTFPWYRTTSLRFLPYATTLLVPWAVFVACTIAYLAKSARSDGSKGEESEPTPNGAMLQTP